MGRVRTERPSERKREANRANARRPRGRWAGTPERDAIEEAKRLLREAIPEGAKRLAALIRDPATSAELFLQAFKLAGDRAGLPPLTQSEVRAMGGITPLRLILHDGEPEEEADAAARSDGAAQLAH